MTTKTAQTIVEKLSAISIATCLGCSFFSVLSAQWLMAVAFFVGATVSFIGGVILFILIDLWQMEHPSRQSY